MKQVTHTHDFFRNGLAVRWICNWFCRQARHTATHCRKQSVFTLYTHKWQLAVEAVTKLYTVGCMRVSWQKHCTVHVAEFRMNEQGERTRCRQITSLPEVTFSAVCSHDDDVRFAQPTHKKHNI